MTDINPQVFFAIQVAADVVLCLAVIFILSRVNRELKRRKSTIDPKAMSELGRLIRESQNATSSLMQAMEESRKALRDVSLSIDDKEARLKRLIEQATSHIDKLDKTSAVLEEALPEKRYDEVIRLAGQGYTSADIAGSLGLSEGEVSLILDLARRRSDSR
jgi:DNA-directed RNA polymerase specialized sigma24 family protein